MKRFNYIEISRGIAAFLVVSHHATLDAPYFYNHIVLNNLFYFGKAGVDFFFVLSGFIIYYVHSSDISNFQNLKTFFFKRVIRIYPTYILISFMMLMAFIFFPDLSSRVNATDVKFILQSFLLLPSEKPLILSVGWTLMHEMFFYFLFFIFILNKKLGTLIFMTWGMLILAFNILFINLEFPLSFYFNKYNLEFLIGVLVALIVKKNNVKVEIYFKCKIIFYFALCLFFINGLNVNYNWIIMNDFVVTLIYSISSSLIILGLVFWEKYSQNFISKQLLLIGTASYSIYLIHRPFQSIVHRIIDKTNLENYYNPNIIFIFVVMSSVFIGIIFYKVIEEPVQRYLKERFFKTKL